MAVRQSGLLPIPVLLVIAVFVYSLIRVRVWPLVRRLAKRRPGRIDPVITVRST